MRYRAGDKEIRLEIENHQPSTWTSHFNESSVSILDKSLLDECTRKNVMKLMEWNEIHLFPPKNLSCISLFTWATMGHQEVHDYLKPEGM